MAPDCYKTIARTVAALRAQTVCRQLELVIVAPSEQALGLPQSATTAFHSVQVIGFGEIRTLSAARAAAIRSARAPLVTLGEDHAFPEPGWAEALIQAHRQSWAAVGPAFLNCNPGMMSWVSLIMDYGRWVGPTSRGVTDDVPGHNSAWKRALLLEYDATLEWMMQAPTILHWDLEARGHQLYFEPAAKVLHTNISRLPCFVLDHFYGARIFAAARARRWPWTRKLFYIAGSPVLTIRRLREWLGHIHRAGLDQALLPKAWPLILLSALVFGLGESIGYAFGVGVAEHKVFKYDARRMPYLSAQDRALIASY